MLFEQRRHAERACDSMKRLFGERPAGHEKNKAL